MNSIPILIVEDDRNTAALIESYLRRDGFSTIKATDGIEAIELFTSETPRLVVLDVMLPRLDGFAVCSEIRKESQVPILFLTARDDEVDCVLGLGLGADDYVAKPFSPRTLVARIKALLRRSQMTAAVTPSAVTGISGLTFDRQKRRFLLHGESLELTPLEFTLLKTLFSTPGRVFLRSELLDKLYPGGEVVIDRVVDVHVGKIRQKLFDDPENPTYIHTVRGLGYRFSDPK